MSFRGMHVSRCNGLFHKKVNMTVSVNNVFIRLHVLWALTMQALNYFNVRIKHRKLQLVVCIQPIFVYNKLQQFTFLQKYHRLCEMIMNTRWSFVTTYPTTRRKNKKI